MRELRGLPVANALTETLGTSIAALSQKGIIPKLAVIRVGNREDDLSYEKAIMSRFAKAGALVAVTALPEDVTQETLETALALLNNDSQVHGILVFRPLPRHLSEQRLKMIIHPNKDIDCMGTVNIAGVFEGNKSCFPPCTPQAVVEMLDFYEVNPTGKKVTIVGRSMVVGKPLAMLMLGKNATVTVCHTKTQELPLECRQADILIACAGSAGMITAEHVRPGQIVIDVGINMVEGKLCGDVVYETVAEIVDAVTPVPGGVGTVTASVLLKHTCLAAQRSLL